MEKKPLADVEILYFPCDHLMKENTGVGSNLAAPAHGPRVSTEGLRGWEGYTPGAGCRPGPGPGLVLPHPRTEQQVPHTHEYSHKQSNPFPRNTRTL